MISILNLFQAALLISLFSGARAAAVVQMVTAHMAVTVTPEPSTKTVTAGRFAKYVVDQTITATTTLFKATTTPITLEVGTIITTLSTIQVNPVTQYSIYSTTFLSETENPSTYTKPVTVYPQTTETSIVASIPKTSQEGTTVPSEVPSTLQTIVLSTGSATKSAEGSQSPAESSSFPSPSSGPGFEGYSNVNLFFPISIVQPPSVFSRQAIPVTPVGVNVDDSTPIHTNKFYTNMMLNDQTGPAYVQPYSVWFSKTANFPGFAVSHTTKSQMVFGPDSAANPVQFYINPVGLISLQFSASEFTSNNMALTLTNPGTFSVEATVSGGSGSIAFPLVQGMGFVTAVYSGLTPVLNTQIGISSLTQSPAPQSDMLKYTATLFNGAQWVIYVTVPSGSDFKLSAKGTQQIVGSGKSSGVIIQIATGSDLSFFDKAAGSYPTSAAIDGKVSADGTLANYQLSYETSGSSIGGTTFLWALPHHVTSFEGGMAQRATTATIDSTTKGVMTGYLTNEFLLQETLNPDVQFLATSESVTYSWQAMQLLVNTANQELAEDMEAQTNLDSTYFSGKGLDKFAYILLVANDILKSGKLSTSGLASLKNAFALFLNNKQTWPLMYDTKFKGITSSAGQGGDGGRDFGSPFYNDHHFHYGYFIHAAAVIGYIDSQAGGTWVQDNKDWVNSLVRDVANPSLADRYFPVFRSFDWFSGHSWAKGLFVSSDGKDEESSSEDYNFSYGMKLWGRVSGDKSMEARGDLMLAVMKRSMNLYFLMTDDNVVQPANFIKNKVPGITFENKLDCVTYFGTNKEYIHGIHMIPLTPASTLIRGSQFVKQEWDEQISGIVNSVDSGWTSILRMNQALYDPISAYNFFAQDRFQTNWLDGGNSRTWALAFTGGLAGSQ